MAKESLFLIVIVSPGSCRIPGGWPSSGWGKIQLDHKQVAIEQLRPELLSEADCQEWIDRFSNEANMHLPSDHVVQGYQFGQQGNNYFYVMEYRRWQGS